MKLTISSIIIASCLLLTATAIATSDDHKTGSNDYDLTWYTIDGGGGSSTGGSFELAGTIGQPDAGSMTGGSYTLVGGYWSGASDVAPNCPVIADLNCDGVVDVSDLLSLLGVWGSCDPPCPADLNTDGQVDVSDLLTLLSNWG